MTHSHLRNYISVIGWNDCPLYTINAVRGKYGICYTCNLYGVRTLREQRTRSETSTVMPLTIPRTKSHATFMSIEG